MKIQVVENTYFQPEIDRVIPGVTVYWKTHIYIKLDLRKVGVGIGIDCPEDHCILVNPKYGSIRTIADTTKVYVLEQVDDSIPMHMLQTREEVQPKLRW